MSYLKDAIKSLKAEIASRERAIGVLENIVADGATVNHVKRAIRKTKRKLSRAGREAIRNAVKRRWAKVHANQKKAAK